MAYFDDEEEKQTAGGAAPAPGPAPTFSMLQRQGMPRPPAPNGAYGGGIPPRPMPSAPYGSPQYDPNDPSVQLPAAPQPRFPMPHQGRGIPPIPGRGPGGPDAHPQQPAETGGAQQQPRGPYVPTNELNQGNLEGYLYDMLANPTATPTYQNSMRQIGSQIDTDASKRGVYYSTLPVGAYSNAGSNLASQLQQQAYQNLQGYNQNYEQLLMALLGQT